jgi:hypothetical protein
LKELEKKIERGLELVDLRSFFEIKLLGLLGVVRHVGVSR